MKKSLPIIKLSLAALLSGTAMSQAQTTDTWNGSGADANWTTAGNWTPGAPNPGDNLIFAGTTQTSPNNDVAATNGYGGITFDATAGGFSLLGNAINFGGVIENDSIAAQAIDLQLILTNGATINTTAGDINIGMNGAGGISGTNSVTVNGPGTLSVSNKTYSGGTLVNSGATMNAWNDNGSYTLAGGSLFLNFGSWYSTASFAFTADSKLGVNVAGSYSNNGRYDSSGTIGSPGFKWTVVGTGRFQIFGHVAASSVEVTAPAVLGALANGSANLTGLGTEPIEVDNGAAIRVNNGGIVQNPITLHGGDGPDGNGALVANQEAFSGLPGGVVANATFTNAITLLNDNGDSSFGAQVATATVGSTMAVSGNITGPGGLVKIGPKLLNLSGNNTYGGNTTINAGTLQVGSPGALPNGPTNGSVYLNGTSKLDLNGFNVTVNYFQDDGSKNDLVDNSSASPASLYFSNGGYVYGAVGNSGGGPLSIISSGSVSLIGANTYTGSNVVQSGTLEITIPTGSTGGLVSVADGATLQLNYGAANSSLQASSASFNGPSSGVNLIVNLNHYPNPSKPVINATNGSGVVTINGTVNFSFSGIDALSGGTIHLIKYTTLAGVGSFTQPYLGAGITATIVTNASTKTIDLVVQQPILTWTGNINNLWDLSTTNWIFTGIRQAYADGNPILFDDTAKTNTVFLTTTMTPASVLVNTTNTYTFTGAGPLNGGQLTLNGSGKLILATTNASGYGNTIIAGGTLQVGNGGSIGSLGSGTVDDEGVLAFNFTNNQTTAVTISGSGSVVNNNTNTLTVNNAANTYTGGTVVNQGILKLGTANTLGTNTVGNLVTVSAGASLDLNGQYLGAPYPVVISGSGAAGTLGALTSISGGGGMNLGYGNIGVNNLSLAGDATIGNSACNWQIGNSGVGISGNNHVLAINILGGNSLYLRTNALTSPSQVIIGTGRVYFCENTNALGSAAVTLTNGGGFDTWNNSTGTGFSTGNPGLSIYNNVTVGIGGGSLNNDSAAYNGSHANYDTYLGSFMLNANLTLRNTATRGGGIGKITITGPIAGSGGIICNQTVTNVSVLTGTCTYTGNTVVNSGILQLTGNMLGTGAYTTTNLTTLQLSAVQQGGGAYTNYDGGLLDVPGQVGYTTVPMSNLALLGTSSGATLSLSRLTAVSTNNAPITATNLVLTGTNSILPPGIAFVSSGQYPLIKYTTISGGITNLVLAAPGVRGIPGYLSNNIAKSSIDLVVVVGSNPVSWVGNVSSNWDIATTQNWKTNGVSTDYEQTGSAGDAVTFDDTATQTNVLITTPVSPAIVTVNAAKTYKFYGTNLTGGTALIKNGTGSLVLSNYNNNVTGGGAVNAGSLVLGQVPGYASTFSGTFGVANGATLDLGSNIVSTLIVNALGAGVGGNGAVQANYTGSAASLGVSVLNMNSNLTVGGNNRWDIRNGANQLNVAVPGSVLTKAGAGQVSVVGTTVSTNLGDVVILGGKVSVQNGATLGNTNNTVYIGASGGLDFYAATVPFTKNIIFTNGAQISVSGGSGANNTIFSTFNFPSGATLNFNFGGGILNIASPINIPSGCTLNNNGNYYQTITYSNVISGSGSFNLQYQSNFKLAASNTFSGNLTIPNCNSGSGGIFYLIGNGSIRNVPNIYIQGIASGQASPGRMDVSGRVDGTLTLSPNQTLRGDLAATINGTVAAPAGSTIFPGGDGNTNCCYMIMTNLTTTGGVLSFDVLSTTNDQVWVPGTLNVTGGATVRAVYTATSGLTNGARFHLISFGTKNGSAASNLKLALNGPHFTAAHLDDTTTAHWVDLVIDDTNIIAPQTLTWAGDGGLNFWDPATSSDWLNGSISSKFYYGDTVSFTDPGTNPIVTLPSVVTPASVTVNSTANYTFTGVGGITGNAVLTKTNTGTLVINTANSFTGGTLINGGTVVMGNSGALWNNTNSFVTVTNGATLDFAGFNPNSLNISVSGAGVGGNGALIGNYTGAGVANGPAVINLLGDTTIGGTNRWDLRNGTNRLTAPVTGCTLTKVGSGYTALVGTAVSTNLGDIYVLGGTLGYQTGTTGLGNTNNTIYIGSGGTLEMYQATVPLNKNIVCSNGATILPDSGGGGGGATTTQNIISGPIAVVSGQLRINCNYYNGCAISNVISGAGGVYFDYNAYNRLYAPNTYTGDTTVYGGVYLFANSCIVSTTNIYENGGPLFLTNNAYVNSTFLHDNNGAVIVGGSATILSTNIWFNGATYLDISGRTDSTLTLANNQSLRGDTGNYIKGNVVATSSSSITPGGSANIQTMVFSNNLTMQSGSTLYMDVSRNGAALSSDLIKGSTANTLSFAGTLVITNAGPNLLGVGDTFTIATNFATFSGSLVGSVVSLTPWETVTWSSPANGQIRVASVVTNTPTIGAAVNGSILSLAWPINFLGGNLQTNAVGLDTPAAWYNYPGSASLTNVNIPISKTLTNLYFRMIHP